MAGQEDSQNTSQIEEINGQKLREIGDQAVWSLSSCKPGFGIEQLRDGNLETYWQSDGPQPHLVNIQFRRKTAIQNISLYADYKADESYTPSKISIRVGNSFHDLHQVELIELEEPSGWLTVPLCTDGSRPIRTYMVQVAVLANHQNGRDTHMRQIKIHAPLADTGTSSMPSFTSVDCAMYSTIR
jgi:anaphase-promoting complex subunit 10